MLVRASAFAAVGVSPDAYGLGYRDVELCLELRPGSRTRRAGHRVLHGLGVAHPEEASLRSERNRGAR
jgi:GT2 family glycosyltransferase